MRTWLSLEPSFTCTEQRLGPRENCDRTMATVAAGILLQLFSLMWSSPDVIGQFSPNVVSFSPNVVLRDPLFSLNSVSKPRMLSVRGNYVLSSLQLARSFCGRPCRRSRRPAR